MFLSLRHKNLCWVFFKSKKGFTGTYIEMKILKTINLLLFVFQLRDGGGKDAV